MSYKKKRHLGNRLFVSFLCIYFSLLLIVISLSCMFSYHQKKTALLAQINSTYAQLKQEYSNITDNFWQVYMPLFESNSNIKSILTMYFSKTTALNPFDKLDINYAANQLMLRDNDIQWIVFYNPNRDTNYIQFNDGSSLQMLPADFPYLEDLTLGPNVMEIYGMRPLSNKNITYNTFSISSGVPSSIGHGKILVGYSIGNLKKICNNTSSNLQSLTYVLTNNGDPIFVSSGVYNSQYTYFPKQQMTETIVDFGSDKLFTTSQPCGLNTSMASFHVSWREFHSSSHIFTPLLFAIAILFTIIAVVGYLFVHYKINKEVIQIQNGLDEISKNNLDYQLPTKFNQSGFPEIAESINHMVHRLKKNIDRAYYYELKQREAELSELQSKFNPHFLYNSLEMLRIRCHQNNDDATANLISQLASIFRGFISSKTFIPMMEELAFSKRYLSLFCARYEDKVSIRYDFDKDILQFGIIRNLFQPLIENYFVHGFDGSGENNYVLFKGKSLDESTMILTIEDNGYGMNDEDIAQLNAKLHEPIEISTESYGLKNLHQRIQLFYGEDYGLSIQKNTNAQQGLSIQIKLAKLTCEEYSKIKQQTYSSM